MVEGVGGAEKVGAEYLTELVVYITTDQKVGGSSPSKRTEIQHFSCCEYSESQLFRSHSGQENS